MACVPCPMGPRALRPAAAQPWARSPPAGSAPTEARGRAAPSSRSRPSPRHRSAWPLRAAALLPAASLLPAAALRRRAGRRGWRGSRGRGGARDRAARTPRALPAAAQRRPQGPVHPARPRRPGVSATASASCGGAGRGLSCAPRSKISPGPGWILVVGPRWPDCAKSCDSSMSCTRRPAFNVSPRTRISRWISLPLLRRLEVELRKPRIVGHELADGVDDQQRARERVLALQREVVVGHARIELGAQRLRHGGALARLVGERAQAASRSRASATAGWRPRPGPGPPAAPSGTQNCQRRHTERKRRSSGGSRFRRDTAAVAGGSGTTATTSPPQAATWRSAGSTAARRAAARSTVMVPRAGVRSTTAASK